jgi:hypothetical protein
MPKWFTQHELAAMDALTANNPAVLVSFGGTPAKMKGFEDDFDETLRAGGDAEQGDGYGLHRARSSGSRGRSAVRQRAGSMHR